MIRLTDSIELLLILSRRCKKIGEAGSQQLLLDTQAIKGLLLEFPTAGESSNPKP